MSKFKVGDKVKLHSESPLNMDIRHLQDTIVMISECLSNEKYRLNADQGRYRWRSSFFTKVED